MRVTLFGASGKVGSLVLKSLLERNYEVVAFVHSKPVGKNKKLPVSKGDIHNLSDVADAIKGSDIVISTLGSWGTKTKDIVSIATENIIAGSNEHKSKRIITLTGSDAHASSDKPSFIDKIIHLAIKLSPARKILFDGDRHIELLEKTDLNWTVIRSPIMNKLGDPKYFSLTTKKPSFVATINRQSVAKAIVEAIDDKKLYKKAVFITRSKF